MWGSSPTTIASGRPAASQPLPPSVPSTPPPPLRSPPRAAPAPPHPPAPGAPPRHPDAAVRELASETTRPDREDVADVGRVVAEVERGGPRRGDDPVRRQRGAHPRHLVCGR